MRRPKFGKISLILTVLSVSLTAQNLQSAPARQSSAEARGGEKRIEKRVSETVKTTAAAKRDAPVQRLTFIKQKRSKEQNRRLSPNQADVNRYAAFLQQPGTGIIRLTDDRGCEANAYVLRADQECLNAIPGGAFYSFREREYSSPALADLRLKDGLLISDGVLSQNILVNLGDVPLENLSLESAGVRFLREFVPAPDTKTATEQYIQLTRGVAAENFNYYKVLPAIPDATYAMRLIAYRGRIIGFFRGFPYDLLAGNNRTDMLLAFRIIRKENDNITLLWKTLERRKAPKIIASDRRK